MWRSVVAIWRKYLMRIDPGRSWLFSKLFELALRFDLARKLDRDHQDDIVEDPGLDKMLAQAEPLANIDELLVVSAPEEPDLMIVLHRGFDLHPQNRPIRVRLLDLVER